MMDGKMAHEWTNPPKEESAVGRGRSAETDAKARLARQMALISEVGSEVIALLDVGVLLPEVVTRVQQGMGYRWMALALVEDDALQTWAQSPSPSADTPAPWQERAVQRAVRAAEPLTFPTGDGHAAAVAVPLRVQDRVLGGLVVEFGNVAESEATDLPFLTTVASLVAMAVENIRLFGMAMQQSHYLDRRATRLSRMLEASDHLQRVGPSQDGLLRAVARLAHESLDFGVVAVSRLDRDGKGLVTRVLTTKGDAGPPDVRAVRGDWERLAVLLRPEFQMGRSFRIDGAQLESAGWGDGPFHLPEVWPGEGPWRPRKALVIPFHERDGREAGALTLDAPHDDRLPSRETVQAAEIFANQVAVALDNARLFDELQRRLRETNTLFVMGQGMVTTLDQDQVLESVAQAALKLVAAAGKAAIHLVDKFGYLIPRVVRPLKVKEAAPKGMRMGRGIAGMAAQRNRSLYVSDVRRDERFVGLATGFVSLLVVPIAVGERVIGTLSVDSPQPDAFRPDDERVLVILANQAAIALENARLYAEAKRVDELAALNRLTVRLSSTLDRAALLRMAVEEVIGVLRAEAATVVRLSEDEARSAPYVVLGRRKRDDASVEVHELLPDRWGGDLLTELSALGVAVRSSLQVVMMARERVLGYVEVYNPLEQLPSDETMSLLSSMAGAVGMALENARLYEEVRISAEQLAASQARLIQSAKLAATGRLAASIAHEINNPLQAVQSCVYLLSESVPVDDPNRSYLDTAVEELERMARIVGRMVEFYRPARANREPTDANRLLEGVLKLTRKRIQEGNVRLHTDLDPRLPEITATADHIKQVFLNVVLNALDAMPNGGDLTVSSRLVVVPDGASLSVADMQWAEFRFSDTGVGIEAEDLPRIFDPFFTSKPKGTGLGLSVSYDIVERHGGAIEVESEPGKGATLIVRLPVRTRPDGRWGSAK